MIVERLDLPFRRERPKGPPRPGGDARDRAGLEAAVLQARGAGAGPVYLGGHSYGGRQASLLAAQKPGLVSALLLLSYPLHPPGRPDQPRTAHFPALATPVLFVHGDRDPFGSVAELAAAVEIVSARKQVLVIEGAGHDLRRGRGDIPARVAAAFTALLSP